MATNVLTKNNARSTLLSGITAAATNLSVQAGHGARFSAPVTGQLVKLTLYDAAGNIEICHGITRSGDGWSVIVRGQEGTTARAWNAGDGIAENATAAFLNGLSQLDREETATAKKTFSAGAAFNAVTEFGNGLGPSYINNIGLAASVAAKALTIALKTKALADPSVSSPVEIAFRNRTITTGDYVVRQITAASSIVVPSGATLGFAAAEAGSIHVYMCDNGTTREIGIINGYSIFNDASKLHNTTAISTAADSANALYTTNAMTNAAIRYIGRVDITTGAIAGEWDNAPTRIYLGDSHLSARAVASGYTRITNNLCRKTTFSSSTGLVRDVVTLVSSPSPFASGMIIKISATAKANAGALLRTASVSIYSDSGATNLIASVNSQHTETVAEGHSAGDVLDFDELEAHVYGSSVYLLFSDDAGNQGTGSYAVLGYYD